LKGRGSLAPLFLQERGWGRGFSRITKSVLQGLEANTNLTPQGFGKGVLQGIGNQFINNQATRNSGIKCQGDWLHVALKGDAMSVSVVGAEKCLHQGFDIFLKVNLS
jgi:hypothetical protein